MTVTDWQPIETAPCVGKKRLLFALAGGGFGVGFRYAGTRLVVLDHNSKTSFRATHWMPLPPALETKP
jgi:hypothetical protein